MVSLTELTNMQVEEIGQVHKGKLDIIVIRLVKRQLDMPVGQLVISNSILFMIVLLLGTLAGHELDPV